MPSAPSNTTIRTYRPSLVSAVNLGSLTNGVPAAFGAAYVVTSAQRLTDER